MGDDASPDVSADVGPTDLGPSDAAAPWRCAQVGVPRQDDYPADIACTATGKLVTVQCHKQGSCTGIGDGTQCAWGAGSSCGDPCQKGLAGKGWVAKQGAKLVLDGKDWRFVGMNVRGLVHHGGKDVLPWATTAMPYRSSRKPSPWVYA